MGTRLAFLQSRPLCGTLWSKKHDNIDFWKTQFKWISIKKLMGKNFTFSACVSLIPKYYWVLLKERWCNIMVNNPWDNFKLRMSTVKNTIKFISLNISILVLYCVEKDLQITVLSFYFFYTVFQQFCGCI